MIRIAIVDDEPVCREKLQQHISSMMEKMDEKYSFALYSDAIELLEHYDFSFDIIFLDIEMKHSNGMKTAQKIRKMDERVIIIFETKLAQYAVEGYTVDAIGYLVKPVDYYSVSLVMTKAMARLSQMRNTKKMIVMDEHGKTLLESREVLYIEVLNHMLVYHTVKGEYRDWTSLSQREKELASCHFFRCHRCYLVNLDHVSGLNTAGDAVEVEGARLPLSRGKKTELMETLMNYFCGEGGGEAL